MIWKTTCVFLGCSEMNWFVFLLSLERKKTVLVSLLCFVWGVAGDHSRKEGGNVGFLKSVKVVTLRTWQNNAAKTKPKLSRTCCWNLFCLWKLTNFCPTNETAPSRFDLETLQQLSYLGSKGHIWQNFLDSDLLESFVYFFLAAVAVPKGVYLDLPSSEHGPVFSKSLCGKRLYKSKKFVFFFLLFSFFSFFRNT